MLRELLKKPILRRPRTCESCGSSFECQLALKGCWCTEIKLTDDARAALASQYKDCLCPTCLQTLATNGTRGPQEV